MRLAAGIDNRGAAIPSIVSSRTLRVEWAKWVSMIKVGKRRGASSSDLQTDLIEAAEMPPQEGCELLAGEGEYILQHAMLLLELSDWVHWLKMPLERAASGGKEAMVILLLKAGVGTGGENLEYWPIPGETGRTLLHAAADGANERVVTAFLEAGANVLLTNEGAPGTFSVFHVAAMTRAVDVVRTLACAGARVHDTARYGQSALHLAASVGHPGMVDTLVRELRLRLYATDYCMAIPLHFAAWHGRAECCRVLLDAGTAVDSVDNKGYTPLCKAAECEGSGGTAAVHVLLGRGAKVQGVPRHTTISPLSLACMHGNLDTVRVLLQHGADETDVMSANSNIADCIRSLRDASPRTVPHETLMHICEALAKAPAERVWRCRGRLVLLRTRYRQCWTLMANETVCAARETATRYHDNVLNKLPNIVRTTCELGPEEAFRMVVLFL